MLDLNDQRQASIERRLRQEEFAYFTTVRPDGSPHTAPVCFIWDGAAILIFTQPESVKARNLRQNAHVTLALDNFGRDNTPVVVEGLATLVTEPGVSITMALYVEKYTRVIEGMGVSWERMAEVYSQAIRIAPTRIRQDQ
ncbi:MAG: pyridoxamine 5'-phosphate oxidase family protein [Ktedonobacterales bacterium]